jgi:hypothetical protein
MLLLLFMTGIVLLLVNIIVIMALIAIVKRLW